MRIILIAILSLFSLTNVSAQQVLELKNWCMSKCDIAGDERKNTELLYHQRANNYIKDSLVEKNIHKYPLRIGVVNEQIDPENVDELKIKRTIAILNAAFLKANIQFYIARVDMIASPLKIADLSEDYYEVYNRFSETYDLQDTISIFLFDYDHEFCKHEGNAVSCGRTGGFSYILSEKTNNIVLSKFDLEDHKIIVHEFGHFFGLYHTFEEHLFGKEKVSRENCEETGDRICDTPADPGTLYEVYVNYSTCEMIGFLSSEEKQAYRPLIQNYMSYYKPCYLKEYAFTPMQLDLMHMASSSSLRRRFQEQKK